MRLGLVASHRRNAAAVLLLGGSALLLAATGSQAWSATDSRLHDDRLPHSGSGLLSGLGSGEQGPALPVVAQMGGNTSAVDVADGHAYFGVGPRLAVAGVAAGAEPDLIGFSDVLPGPVQDVAVAGDYAFVADLEGLTALDIQVKSRPHAVGSVELPFAPAALDLAGEFAYVTGNGVALAIVSVSEPQRPSLVGLRDGYWLAASDIDVHGDIAYLAAGSRGLLVISVADPAHPQDLARLEEAEHAYSIAASDGFAYVATMSNGLMAISVSDPANPTVLGSLTKLYLPTGMYLAGSRLFIADTSRLHVYLVGADGLPTHRSETSFDRFVYDVAVCGNMAYVIGHGKLREVSFEVDTAPRELGALHLPGSFNCVSVEGNFAYLTGADGDLWIASMADPSQPRIVGQVDFTDDERRGFDAQGQALDVVGNYVYLVTWEGILHVVSIADKDQPRLLGSISVGIGGQKDLSVAGNYAYVVANAQGLRVVSVADALKPVEVAFLETRDALAVHVVGDHAYLANGSHGLGVFSVADPRNPRQVGSFDTPGMALDIYVVGDLAYVADDQGGLRIVSVADPAAPREVGVVESPDLVRRIHAHDEWIVTGLEGDQNAALYSTAAPRSPSLVGSADLPGRHTRGLDIQGEHLYVAGPDLGLFVLRLDAGPVTPTMTPSERPTNGASATLTPTADPTTPVSTIGPTRTPTSTEDPPPTDTPVTPSPAATTNGRPRVHLPLLVNR